MASEGTDDRLADVADGLQGCLPELWRVVRVYELDEVFDQAGPLVQRQLDGGEGGDELSADCAGLPV